MRAFHPIPVQQSLLVLSLFLVEYNDFKLKSVVFHYDCVESYFSLVAIHTIWCCWKFFPSQFPLPLCYRFGGDYSLDNSFLWCLEVPDDTKYPKTNHSNNHQFPEPSGGFCCSCG